MRIARLWCLVVVVGCGDDAATSTDGGIATDDASTCADEEELCGDGVDNNCNGTVDEDCAGGIGTFVSVKRGNDTNPGTLDMPVKTIGKGIANAMTLGGSRTVVVGEGEYPEKVTLVEGVDLLGGHQCDMQSCTFVRDIAAHASTIANTDFAGVIAGPTITPATLVSGFTILGLGGAPTSVAGSVAVACNGGSPTLRGNRITGGNVGAGADGSNRSIGLALHATTMAAIIENNEITGGSGSQSIGVAFETGSSLASVTNNVIRSGTARRSTGVLALRAQMGSLLQGNDIYAGSSMGGASVGVQVSSPITVDSNRINVDRAVAGTCSSPVTWCAGIAVEGATTTISNNIVFGARGARAAGLLLAEVENPAGTVTVVNNYVNAGGSSGQGPGSRTESAAIAFVIGGANAMFTGEVGRVRNNILDGGSGNTRFGLREDPAASRTIRPAIVDSNAFTFSNLNNRTDVLYREVSAEGDFDDHTSIIGMELTSLPPTMNNFEDNPLLDATWHLTGASPCIDTGTSTDAPTNDFDGDVRPAKGVDVGPDEASEE